MHRDDLSIDCPSCSEKVSVRAIKCPQCETNLRMQCKVCKGLISISSKQCPECGTTCLSQKQQKNNQLSAKDSNIFLKAIFFLKRPTRF